MTGLREQGWWLGGSRVPDVYRRSADAEFIFDSDFTSDEKVSASELEWRECSIPIDAFDLGRSLEEHLEKIVGHADDERERCLAIKAWMDACGGVEKALEQSPLLVTIKDGALKLEDGYHRLGVAVFMCGAASVRAVCAEVRQEPQATALQQWADSGFKSPDYPAGLPKGMTYDADEVAAIAVEIGLASAKDLTPEP